MVIQKGLAALAILAAFTIAAEGVVCRDQWTGVGSASLYYSVKSTVLCDHCKAAVYVHGYIYSVNTP